MRTYHSQSIIRERDRSNSRNADERNATTEGELMELLPMNKPFLSFGINMGPLNCFISSRWSDALTSQTLLLASRVWLISSRTSLCASKSSWNIILIYLPWAIFIEELVLSEIPVWVEGRNLIVHLFDNELGSSVSLNSSGLLESILITTSKSFRVWLEMEFKSWRRKCLSVSVLKNKGIQTLTLTGLPVPLMSDHFPLHLFC